MFPLHSTGASQATDRSAAQCLHESIRQGAAHGLAIGGQESIADVLERAVVCRQIDGKIILGEIQIRAKALFLKELDDFLCIGGIFQVFRKQLGACQTRRYLPPVPRSL
jgi:hypothetical protein